jgi:hypothetical protein
MKHLIRYATAMLAVAGIVAASQVLAGDKSSSQKLDPNNEEMMKKIEAAGAPGPAHKALEPLIGKWDVEVKTWMAPEAPPTVTKGTATATWAMNGRFVQEEFKGEFMGKPFRGVSFTGYDNLKQKFNSVWIDDMHTSLFTSEGRGEEGNKVVTLEGEYDCPITGQKDVVMKQVLRIISEDKHVLEMHDASKGGKTMEITYTRR